MYGKEEFNPDPFDVKIKWINGSCYRIYKRKLGNDDEIQEHRKLKPYCEYDDEEEYEIAADKNCTNEKDPLSSIDIKQKESGRFETTIAIPHKFYAYIIGTKGSRKKQLENETKTEITIPRVKSDKNICINGPTASNVISARRRIELIAFDLRDRHAITHFISFPLIVNEIKTKFNEFKNSVLNDDVKGIDETVFTKNDKLHLTIGTLVLLDDEEIQQAAEVLNKMKEEIVSPFITQTGPITLHMKGLQYMNDDPSQVDVLYATIEVVGQETNHQIQQLSNDIVDYFHKQGLMKKDNDNVKLHATLINTRYRRERSPVRANGRPPKRISFDARLILEKYGSFDFGKQEFKSIHLSERSTVDKNGYYGCKGSISLRDEQNIH